MFLRKVDGSRTATLPDGSTLSRSRADLPPADTRRRVASGKAIVVKAVLCGLIPLKEALETYAISEGEFVECHHAVEAHGGAALKATAMQKYRHL